MVKFFENLFDFYINSSIHVSLAVASLFLITTTEFNLGLDEDLLYFVFFGSVTGYNFVKYAGVAKLHHRSLAKSLKLIQIFSFLCFGLFVYFAFQISFRTLCIAGFFGLLTLLYALPIFPKRKNLRSLGGFKIFVIATVWSGSTVVLPILNAEYSVDWELIIEFVQRILFVIAITLPFEIRDLKYDDSELKTIPQELGISRTKKTGIFLLLFSLALDLIVNWQPIFVISYFVIVIFSSFLILKSKINQPKYYASFWVESLPILWWLILMLMQSIF